MYYLPHKVWTLTVPLYQKFGHQGGVIPQASYKVSVKTILKWAQILYVNQSLKLDMNTETNH